MVGCHRQNYIKFTTFTVKTLNLQTEYRKGFDHDLSCFDKETDTIFKIAMQVIKYNIKKRKHLQYQQRFGVEYFLTLFQLDTCAEFH